MMKKSLSCLLLASVIFSLNAAPAHAAKREKRRVATNKSFSIIVPEPGRWCFKLPHMGIFCYDL